MKETVRSLKIYFILSGLFAMAANLLALRGLPGIGAAIAVIGILLGIAFLYIGVRLRQMLSTAPSQITRLLIAAVVFQVVLLPIYVFAGRSAEAIPQVILGLLITWYLFANVRRLAMESGQPSGSL